jgi:hypothetical protein
MTRREPPPPHPFSTGHLRLLGALWSLTSAIAHAQAMGQGLISYAQPIILFLGIGAIVVALVAAVFKPEIVKSAVWAAVILTVIFFILRNTSALTSAVSGG